jgi:flavorubredoxin
MSEFLKVYEREIKVVSIVGSFIWGSLQVNTLIKKIDELNITMATIVTKMENSEKQANKLEKRIEKLEDYIFKTKK